MSLSDPAALDRAIERKKAELDRLRPLDPKSVAALDSWYDVELTYSSNALEGNSLTRAETAVILEKGITIGGKPMKDHFEAIDHSDALSFVRDLARTAEIIRESDVRAIHRLVLGRSDPVEAGRYATNQRAILGSTLVLPSPAEIGPLMADFADWFSRAPLQHETAFEAHYRLVTIHPFADGNGRTARLLMNLLLLKAGHPPAAIEPADRSRYVDALDARQTRRDRTPYDMLMRQQLLASLERYVDHLERARSGG